LTLIDRLCLICLSVRVETCIPDSNEENATQTQCREHHIAHNRALSVTRCNEKHQGTEYVEEAPALVSFQEQEVLMDECRLTKTECDQNAEEYLIEVEAT